MATSRKRPPPEDDVQPQQVEAECPFTVIHPNPNETNTPDLFAKRRRQQPYTAWYDHIFKQQLSSKISRQISPFTPFGKFNTKNGNSNGNGNGNGNSNGNGNGNQYGYGYGYGYGYRNTMERYYQVLPHQKWMDMTSYNSFVLNGVKFYSEDFIFVANSSTIERQKNPPTEPSQQPQPRPKSVDDWVARILEIRASDEHHVYARIYWMYRPDELPAGTLAGKKLIQGRQSYHGRNELIASNHMDVINVVSVTAQATVNQWDELNEDEVHKALYWRQGLDLRNMELSSAFPRCKCNLPENPDKRLINCSNTECRRWLHDDCLVHEALMRTFARLGNEKPYLKLEEVKKEPESDERPFSPSALGTGTGTGTGTKSISYVGHGGIEDRTTVTVSGPKRNARRRQKSEIQRHHHKPYEGLFSGIVIGDASPPVIEIRDLRENVGGSKSWTETFDCLLCGTQIY
ncbi:hypothetical protein GGR50DRAFT_51129 [Xylaria sp. CBS 124048]|nr:hypothetical protein GGR50DRAFT_51129 [Xylaria sp. CBS 124048]